MLCLEISHLFKGGDKLGLVALERFLIKSLGTFGSQHDCIFTLPNLVHAQSYGK
jgi:hypothetical protein